MIERFGNPQAETELPRRSMNRSRPASVPAQTPIVWDTPHETASNGADGTPNRFFNRSNERLYEAYSQLHSMARRKLIHFHIFTPRHGAQQKPFKAAAAAAAAALHTPLVSSSLSFISSSPSLPHTPHLCESSRKKNKKTEYEL